jgi:hypothetical protein
VSASSVLVLGALVIGCTTPAPTWWAHDVACAWTAVWMTVRGRTFVGPRELFVDPDSSGRLELVDRISGRALVIGRTSSGWSTTAGSRLMSSSVRSPSEGSTRSCAPAANGSGTRKTNGIVYICGNEAGSRRIPRVNERVNVTPGYCRRLELLDAIKAETRAGFERDRADGEAAAA